LQAYGYALAAIYAGLLLHFYLAGAWIADRAGMPVYSDFTDAWVAGIEALHGKAALIYEPGEFIRMRSALLGPKEFFYPNWPYPPTFLLVLAPLGALRHFDAFIVWDIATLLGFIVNRLFYRSSAAGDRPGAGIAIHSLEFPCRTERISDGLANRSIAACP
jgi:hypothetical protein